MGTLAHGRGAMRRNAERRGGVGFFPLGCGANGAFPVGHPGVGADATSKDGVGPVAANPIKKMQETKTQNKTKSVGGVPVGSGAEWGSADCNGPAGVQSHCARARQRCAPLGTIASVRPCAVGQKNLPILSVPPHGPTCRSCGGECGTRPADLPPNARRRTPQTVSL